MVFRGNSHKNKFSEEIKKYRKPPVTHDNRKLAAVYLLTADNKLWDSARSHIREGQMEFDSVDANGISLDAYTLWKRLGVFIKVMKSYHCMTLPTLTSSVKSHSE